MKEMECLDLMYASFLQHRILHATLLCSAAHSEHHISQINEGNFTQFWSQMYWVHRCAN